MKRNRYIPFTWTYPDTVFFLRDDRSADLCDNERYTLFRADKYGKGSRKLATFSGDLRWACGQSNQAIKDDFDREEELAKSMESIKEDLGI